MQQQTQLIYVTSGAPEVPGSRRSPRPGVPGPFELSLNARELRLKTMSHYPQRLMIRLPVVSSRIRKGELRYELAVGTIVMPLRRMSCSSEWQSDSERGPVGLRSS